MLASGVALCQVLNVVNYHGFQAKSELREKTGQTTKEEVVAPVINDAR